MKLSNIKIKSVFFWIFLMLLPSKFMKRFLAVILSFVLCFSMVGCQKNQLTEKYVLSDREKQVYDFDENISSLINNTSTLDSTKTDFVDIHRFVQRYNPFTFPWAYRMSEIINDIGIGLLRETEEGALYSIYPVKQGGRLLVFYNNEWYRTAIDDRPVLRWFYIRNQLCFNDFKKVIENKCSIEEVIKIDETEQIFKNIWFGDWSDSEEKYEQIGSWHYLSDGILELVYQRDKDSAFIIDYRWHSDFDLEDWQAAKHTPYNARVLDIDWISR